MTTVNENKQERGCLLTGALLLSLLGAIFLGFVSGAYTIANTPERISELEYWLSLVCFLASLYAIYCFFFAYRMQKKGAYGLIAAAAVTVVDLLLDVFLKPPTNDLAKSGARWMLLSVIGCVFFSIIIAFNIKKMK